MKKVNKNKRTEVKIELMKERASIINIVKM